MYSYEADIQVVENIIKEFLARLPDKYEELVSIPDLLGVQNLAASEVILRVIAETLPSAAVCELHETFVEI